MPDFSYDRSQTLSFALLRTLFDDRRNPFFLDTQVAFPYSFLGIKRVLINQFNINLLSQNGDFGAPIITNFVSVLRFRVHPTVNRYPIAWSLPVSHWDSANE